MPWNGSGTFTRKHNWTQEAAVGTPILATNFDDDTNDITGVGLGNCITRDGQGGPTANIPWNNFKITGLANPTLPQDAVPLLFMQNAITAATFNTALPLQTGNAGKFVTTDGTNASWTDTFGVAVKERKGADIPSAATISLTAATGNFVHITGTTGITAITIPIGASYTLIFDGVLTVTASAALTLPGGVASITTAANDRMIVRGDTAGAVVIGHFPGVAATADVTAGTNATKAVTPASLLAGIGFSSYFQSANQTITNAAALTIAHGLGRNPIVVQAFLINLTAELGYSVNDIVACTISGATTTSQPKGVSIRTNSTNILVRYGDGGGSAGTFYVQHATTGVTSPITNANWAFIVRVWA